MPTANDYSKEPVIMLDKAGPLSVGDKVKLNNFYLSLYAGIQHLANLEAEVTKIVSRPISASKLSEDKNDYRMFVHRYGKRDTYDIIGLWIRYPNDARVYLVSAFGCDKV